MLNKYLFAALTLLISGAASAQTQSQKIILKTPNHPVKLNSNILFTPEVNVPNIDNSSEMTQPTSTNRNLEETVGITYWDAQSYGAMSSRIYANDLGEPVAHWLFSAQPTGNSDRGTAQNVRVSGTWGNSNSRVEAARTGFPAAALLGDGTEIIISHNTGANPWAIWMARKTPGGNTWTESAIPGPPGVRMLWPKIAIGGADKMTIHMIAITAPVGGTTGGVIYEGLNGHLLYYKSTDGGITWDKKYAIIPGIDNSRYDGFSADSYTIDASGSSVAIGIFRAYDWNDIFLYKSEDNGETWTDRLVRDFPDALEGYTPLPGVSYTEADVMEIDTLSPDPLAVMTNDGFGSVLIDENGQAHVWFGRMYVIDNNFTDSSSFIYPGTNGIIYWKEDWGPNNSQIITGAFDYDGDGSINASNDQIAPYGGANISSFPVTGIAADGTIYLCYAALNEQHISSENDELFRNLYLMKSTSNGDSWGNPIELTAPPYVDEAIVPFIECVWPSIPRNIGEKVWVLYQQDYLTGSNVWGAHHPPAENAINWIEVDPMDVPVKVLETPKPDHTMQLTLSPNPATSQTILTASFNGGRVAKIEIFDMMGSRVYQNNLPTTSGQQTLAIPVKQLIAGTYWVRVTDGKNYGITKLLVTK